VNAQGLRRGLVTATVVDHVLLPVTNLEEGASRLRERYGLVAVAGGRHANLGTANMIVPLGRQYLELIAIADPQEAARSRIGQNVLRALSEGRTLMSWALRTRDLDALRAKLQGAGWDLPAVWEGSRRRPDGQLLRWRTQDLLLGAEATALPFVIEWDIPEGLYPGEAQPLHPGGPASLRRVVVGAPDPARTREQLRQLLVESHSYEVREAAVESLEAAVLAGADRELVIA
jgi:hypothetical protein